MNGSVSTLLLGAFCILSLTQHLVLSFAPCPMINKNFAVSPLMAERRSSGGRGGRGGGRGSGRGRGGGRGGRGRGRTRRSTNNKSRRSSNRSDNNNDNSYSRTMGKAPQQFTDDFDDDPFGDYDNDNVGYGRSNSYSFDDGDDVDYGYYDDDDDDEYGDDMIVTPTTRRTMQSQNSNTVMSSASAHFFSKKPLSNTQFSIQSETFHELCEGAEIEQASRIQALAWPTLLQGKSAIVADQTGSGKTLSYLLPLLQRMMAIKDKESKDGTSASKKKEYGSPKVLILAPTAELADQIKLVCDKTTANLSMPISSRVITATGSHSTNIRDQIRMLGKTPVDIIISTPGRIATILRTKSSTLNLANLQAIVLDEVDVLLIDETFGPQLRTIGAASPVSQVQFVFVTATLPDEIIDSVKREFRDVEVIQGPGLHRVAINLKENLVDVSVPPSENQNLNLGFEYKAKALMKALRSNRCKRTLVFCNTVDACRKVENLIKRNDRRGRIYSVGIYHNALTPEARRRNMAIFAKAVDRETKGGKKEVVDHILVCTDRAARGVDFDSAPVDHVVIFDFPKDPAEYVRRVGRTARAGRTGTSTVMAFAWQLPIARKIMGSKLESYTVAADDFGDEEDEEFSQKQRQAKRGKKERDRMIKGNIEKGNLWK